MKDLDFKYGDVVLKCHNCNTITTFEPNVKEGRALYLVQKNDVYYKFECPSCKVALEIRMIPSVNPPTDNEDEIEIIEEDTNEELQEEGLEEEIV